MPAEVCSVDAIITFYAFLVPSYTWTTVAFTLYFSAAAVLRDVRKRSEKEVYIK